MKKCKKMPPKHLSSRQKVKAQAKEIKKLRYERTTDKVRINYLRKDALEKQQLINEQDRIIESLKSEIGRLEFELQAKRKMPFWKKVFR